MVSSGVDSNKNVYPILVDADGRPYVIRNDPSPVTPDETLAAHPNGLGAVGNWYAFDKWYTVPVSRWDDVMVNKGKWVIPVTPMTSERVEGTKITDGTTTAIVDPESQGLSVSRAIHQRVVKSNMWMCSYRKVDLADSTSFHLNILVGAAKNMHMTYNVFVEGKSQIYFTENPTLANNGTELTEYNMNRETGTAATGTVYRDPNVTVAGTIIETSEIGQVGHFTAAGGTMDSGSYWMLKKSENYLIWVYNNSGAISDVVIQIMWHED
jgi:hypothetical protein